MDLPSWIFIAEELIKQELVFTFTCHLQTLCFDTIAFKNVVSNGLVLDKNGQKCSSAWAMQLTRLKHLATNTAPDATRWQHGYQCATVDNLKFDEEGIVEVQRKFLEHLQYVQLFSSLRQHRWVLSLKKHTFLMIKPEIDRFFVPN